MTLGVQRFAYPIQITPDRGCYFVDIPDLPGAATQSPTRADAVVRAADCVEEWLAGAITDRRPVPQPSPAKGRRTAAPGMLIAAKTAFYLAMRESGTTNVALGNALGLSEVEVRRMLDPRHATKIRRLEDALAYFGQRLVVTVEAA